MGQPSNRPIKRRIFAFVLAASTIGTAYAAATQPVVGIAAVILKDVRITGAASSQARPAVLRQRVALADRVQTGQRSQLQMLLLDKSLFTIGANAQLTIDRYVYDPGKGRSFSASVAKGAFRFMSGSPDRNGSSSIHTPVATIGIRGTILEGVIGPDAVAIMQGERDAGQGIGGDPQVASLIILRGPGPQTQGHAAVGAITVDSGGKSVMLDRPLLAVYVPERGAAPIGPFTISLPGLERLHDLIFPGFQEARAFKEPAPTQPAYPSPARKLLPVPPEPYGDDGSPPPQYQGPGWPQMPNMPAPRQPTRQSPTTDRVPNQQSQPKPSAGPAPSQAPAGTPNLKSGQ